MISALYVLLVIYKIYGIEEASYLVANDSVGFLVKEDGDSETTSIVRVIGEVEITKMGELCMQRVGNGILPRQIFIRSCEAPS